jgi:hypothetical protein
MKVSVGEIVQLSPETCKNRMFAGCLMIVTEPKSWGAQGYVQALGEDGHPGGQAYYRAEWEEMESTDGRAVWMVGTNIDGEFT